MTQNQSAILAISLWLLVGGLGGAIVSPTIISIVIGMLVGGLVGWQLLRRPDKRLAEPTPLLLAETTPTSDPNEAARQWLDDFLVRQQQKE